MQNVYTILLEDMENVWGYIPEIWEYESGVWKGERFQSQQSYRYFRVLKTIINNYA